MADPWGDAQPAPHRQKFSLSEDAALVRLVGLHGPGNWGHIAMHMPGRTSRQCRDRFANYLAPSLTQGPWSRDEDWIILEKVRQIGLHWAQIAASLPGRSSNAVKNRWYTHLQTGRDSAIGSPDAKDRANLTSFLAMVLNPAPVGHVVGSWQWRRRVPGELL
jgi:hypothetical protein